ncbi:hypothetical protein D3C83_02990 [compost metagenome]
MSIPAAALTVAPSAIPALTVLKSLNTATAAPRPTNPTPPAKDLMSTSSSSVALTLIVPPALNVPPADAETLDAKVTTLIPAPAPTAPPPAPPVSRLVSTSSTALTLMSPRAVVVVTWLPSAIEANVPGGVTGAVPNLSATLAAVGRLAGLFMLSPPIFVMPARRSSLVWTSSSLSVVTLPSIARMSPLTLSDAFWPCWAASASAVFVSSVSKLCCVPLPAPLRFARPEVDEVFSACASVS